MVRKSGPTSIRSENPSWEWQNERGILLAPRSGVVPDYFDAIKMLNCSAGIWQVQTPTGHTLYQDEAAVQNSLMLLSRMGATMDDLGNSRRPEQVWCSGEIVPETADNFNSYLLWKLGARLAGTVLNGGNTYTVIRNNAHLVSCRINSAAGTEVEELAVSNGLHLFEGGLDHKGVEVLQRLAVERLQRERFMSFNEGSGQQYLYIDPFEAARAASFAAVLQRDRLQRVLDFNYQGSGTLNID